jgi:hypothetical protein
MRLIREAPASSNGNTALAAQARVAGFRRQWRKSACKDHRASSKNLGIPQGIPLKFSRWLDRGWPSLLPPNKRWHINCCAEENALISFPPVADG